MNFTLSYLKTEKLAKYLYVFVLSLVAVRFYFAIEQDPLHFVPKHLRKFVRFNESFRVTNNLTVNELVSVVKDINKKCEVLNANAYGRVGDQTVLILIQVHRDVDRLQYLILSLGQVRFIEEVLLIFSHTHYDEQLNNLVRSITFCKVMQIFYPHSSQLNPHKYPGQDFEGKNAHSTEHKQHWWWKANYVFSSLKWSLSHTGMVMFLEEDSYVAPDLLYMMKYLQKSLSYFPRVEMISFGNAHSSECDFGLVSCEPWSSSFSKGIAFNKTLWRKIVGHSTDYCMYDDIFWSYSLQNLLDHFERPHVDTVVCMLPRVISTAEYSSGRRGAERVLMKFAKSHFFPESVKVALLFGAEGKVETSFKTPPKGNGGWKDSRDQLLCLASTNASEGGLQTKIEDVD